MRSDPSHLSQEHASPIKPNGNAFELLDPLCQQHVISGCSSNCRSMEGPQYRGLVTTMRHRRHIIPLLQLVVCGDQSSGKNSVLEAITEIPFPRRENLCTRFTSEIVLRRSPKSSIATKIIPDKARPAKEKEHWAPL
jgi:hypothetical protein